jgi:hypothetical protein
MPGPLPDNLAASSKLPALDYGHVSRHHSLRRWLRWSAWTLLVLFGLVVLAAMATGWVSKLMNVPT